MLDISNIYLYCIFVFLYSQGQKYIYIFKKKNQKKKNDISMSINPLTNQKGSNKLADNKLFNRNISFKKGRKSNYIIHILQQLLIYLFI